MNATVRELSLDEIGFVSGGIEEITTTAKRLPEDHNSHTSGWWSVTPGISSTIGSINATFNALSAGGVAANKAKKAATPYVKAAVTGCVGTVASTAIVSGGLAGLAVDKLCVGGAVSGVIHASGN